MLKQVTISKKILQLNVGDLVTWEDCNGRQVGRGAIQNITPDVVDIYVPGYGGVPVDMGTDKQTYHIKWFTEKDVLILGSYVLRKLK